MNDSPVLVLIIAVAILIVFGVLVTIYVRNKQGDQRQEPDYRAFFILGITFLPVGIATENPGLWGVGAVFLILGLANRNKWKEEPKWSELDPERKRYLLLLILGLTMLLVFGTVFFLFVRNNVFG